MKHPGGNDILTVEALSQFRYGKPDDIRRLEREQQEMQWALEGRSQYDGERLFGEDLPPRLQGGNAPDQDHLRTLLSKNAQTLDAMRPPQDLTPIQRRKYAAMERELREGLQYGMPSVAMMNDPTEYNVEMNMAWQEYNVRKAIAWMNTRQILDPKNDSPFFTSIETLRPTEAPRVDLRKLRMNWDNIAFLDQEDKYDITLDDAVYQEFLRLKVLDWSDKGIMRHLGLTRAALEVANAKLAQERAAAREAYADVKEPLDEDDEARAEAQGYPLPAWDDEAEPGTEEADTEEQDADHAMPVPEEDQDEVTAPPPGPAPLKALWAQPDRSRTWLKEELRRLGLQQQVFARAMGFEGQAINNWCSSLTSRPRVRFLANDWARITHLLELFPRDPAHFAKYGYAPPGLVA
jgi:hypothetical protein